LEEWARRRTSAAGLGEDAASPFESNAKLKPINDEVELASRETQWEGYAPREEPSSVFGTPARWSNRARISAMTSSRFFDTPR
jgi:hypothetical protein